MRRNLPYPDCLVRSAEIFEEKEAREFAASLRRAPATHRRGPRPPNDPTKDRHGKTFRDPVMTRHAVLLASVVGCHQASKITGFDRTTISRWRAKLERETGEKFPRIHNRGNTGYGKLNPAKAREMRERRARGISWGVLARIYKVTHRCCRLVCDGVLYPEPGQ